MHLCSRLGSRVRNMVARVSPELGCYSTDAQINRSASMDWQNIHKHDRERANTSNTRSTVLVTHNSSSCACLDRNIQCQTCSIHLRPWVSGCRLARRSHSETIARSTGRCRLLRCYMLKAELAKCGYNCVIAAGNRLTSQGGVVKMQLSSLVTLRPIAFPQAACTPLLLQPSRRPVSLVLGSSRTNAFQTQQHLVRWSSRLAGPLPAAAQGKQDATCPG